MARLAAKIKTTREAHWLDREKDVPVRRTEAIACLGGAALDNEEGYLLSKAMRGLGIVFLEHQARI
jgi:formate dehydrogenase major subunit